MAGGCGKSRRPRLIRPDHNTLLTSKDSGRNRPAGRRALAGGFVPAHDTTQVTYNGHPLYTYVGDTAPGQAFGNNVSLNGGLWQEVTVSG
jgi:hypothetical protein